MTCNGQSFGHAQDCVPPTNETAQQTVWALYRTSVRVGGGTWTPLPHPASTSSCGNQRPRAASSDRPIRSLPL